MRRLWRIPSANWRGSSQVKPGEERGTGEWRSVSFGLGARSSLAHALSHSATHPRLTTSSPFAGYDSVRDFIRHRLVAPRALRAARQAYSEVGPIGLSPSFSSLLLSPSSPSTLVPSVCVLPYFLHVSALERCQLFPCCAIRRLNRDSIIPSPPRLCHFNPDTPCPPLPRSPRTLHCLQSVAEMDAELRAVETSIEQTGKFGHCRCRLYCTFLQLTGPVCSHVQHGSRRSVGTPGTTG